MPLSAESPLGSARIHRFCLRRRHILELNLTTNINIIPCMKISDFVALAKRSQTILTNMGVPAEHIYLASYSDPKSIPSLVFISQKYNRLDLYHRAQLASLIHQGPLKFNFYVMGTDHLLDTKRVINRDQLYRAVKLYGKQPLILDGVEYASKQDKELRGNVQDELTL